MTEKEKMIGGDWFNRDTPQLIDDRKNCLHLLHDINHVQSRNAREKLFRALLGGVGKGHEIRPPFYCNYGYSLYVGEGFYCDGGAVFLDGAPITIGDNVFIGPRVHLNTTNLPLDSVRRNRRDEQSLSIVIGNSVWIGGGAVICPGVTIDDNAVIGAGAVVTEDVPAYAVMEGNPAQLVSYTT